jgi:hypothetical protein
MKNIKFFPREEYMNIKEVILAAQHLLATRIGG